MGRGKMAVPFVEWDSWIDVKEFKRIFPGATQGMVYTIFHYGPVANPKDKRNRIITKAALLKYLEGTE